MNTERGCNTCRFRVVLHGTTVESRCRANDPPAASSVRSAYDGRLIRRWRSTVSVTVGLPTLSEARSGHGVLRSRCEGVAAEVVASAFWLLCCLPDLTFRHDAASLPVRPMDMLTCCRIGSRTVSGE